MTSSFENFINAEMPKRPYTQDATTSWAAGKALVTTGIGLGVTVQDFPKGFSVKGDWDMSPVVTSIPAYPVPSQNVTCTTSLSGSGYSVDITPGQVEGVVATGTLTGILDKGTASISYGVAPDFLYSRFFVCDDAHTAQDVSTALATGDISSFSFLVMVHLVKGSSYAITYSSTNPSPSMVDMGGTWDSGLKLYVHLQKVGTDLRVSTQLEGQVETAYYSQDMTSITALRAGVVSKLVQQGSNQIYVNFAETGGPLQPLYMLGTGTGEATPPAGYAINDVYNVTVPGNFRGDSANAGDLAIFTSLTHIHVMRDVNDMTFETLAGSWNMSTRAVDENVEAVAGVVVSGTVVSVDANTETLAPDSPILSAPIQGKYISYTTSQRVIETDGTPSGHGVGMCYAAVDVPVLSSGNNVTALIFVYGRGTSVTDLIQAYYTRSTSNPFLLGAVFEVSKLTGSDLVVSGVSVQNGVVITLLSEVHYTLLPYTGSVINDRVYLGMDVDAGTIHLLHPGSFNTGTLFTFNINNFLTKGVYSGVGVVSPTMNISFAQQYLNFDLGCTNTLPDLTALSPFTVKSMGNSLIPTSARDGYKYIVTGGGWFNQKPTSVGDVIELYNNTTQAIIYRDPSLSVISEGIDFDLKNNGLIPSYIASHVSGTGGSAVLSVNGQTGAVTLTASNVGADPAGTAASAIGSHVAASDPHGDRAYASGLVRALTGFSLPDEVRWLEDYLNIPSVIATAATPSWLYSVPYQLITAQDLDWIGAGRFVDTTTGGFARYHVPRGSQGSGTDARFIFNQTKGYMKAVYSIFLPSMIHPDNGSTPFASSPPGAPQPGYSNRDVDYMVGLIYSGAPTSSYGYTYVPIAVYWCMESPNWLVRCPVLGSYITLDTGVAVAQDTNYVISIQVQGTDLTVLINGGSSTGTSNLDPVAESHTLVPFVGCVSQAHGGVDHVGGVEMWFDYIGADYKLTYPRNAFGF